MEGKNTKPGGEAAKVPERICGRVAEWVEERGFGWVEHGGGRLFAHIREFRKGRVPVKGDEVSFLPGLDPLGRPCARELLLKKEHALPGVVGICAACGAAGAAFPGRAEAAGCGMGGPGGDAGCIGGGMENLPERQAGGAGGVMARF